MSIVRLDLALSNAQMDAITAAAGANAKLRFYSGAQPATVNTAIGAQVMLAELICASTLAPAASNRVLTFNAIANGTGTAGASTGTATTWARLFKSDGTTPVADFDVAASGATININNTSIAVGQTVSVTSGSLTNPN